LDKGRPGRYPSRANDHGQGQCDTQRPADTAITSISRRDVSGVLLSAVATEREDHRSPRSDPARQRPRWDLGPIYRL